jgi:hypothetical protein
MWRIDDHLGGALLVGAFGAAEEGRSVGSQVDADTPG